MLTLTKIEGGIQVQVINSEKLLASQYHTIRVGHSNENNLLLYFEQLYKRDKCEINKGYLFLKDSPQGLQLQLHPPQHESAKGNPQMSYPLCF
jgi:ribosomal 30S subunit maturation factor RimM